MYVNDTWNFINGSEWDYCDAMVACKQLGNAALLCVHV